jgi:hypothetical protein
VAVAPHLLLQPQQEATEQTLFLALLVLLVAVVELHKTLTEVLAVQAVGQVHLPQEVQETLVDTTHPKVIMEPQTQAKAAAVVAALVA